MYFSSDEDVKRTHWQHCKHTQGCQDLSAAASYKDVRDSVTMLASVKEHSTLLFAVLTGLNALAT